MKYNIILRNGKYALLDMENSMAVVMPRFQIGARWFDDIVMNNAAREN